MVRLVQRDNYSENHRFSGNLVGYGDNPSPGAFGVQPRRTERTEIIELQLSQTQLANTLSLEQYYPSVKRVLDLIVASIALILLLPTILLITVLIKLDSPGPALFIQIRIGKGSRPFRMFKFRTLCHNLEDPAHKALMRAFVKGEIGKDGTGKTVYKPFQESQVTRMGRILRKTSLDELPQLLNILKGEMSLVGPRPNVPWEVEEYKSWHMERLTVLPGLTGLAQINGRSCIDFNTIVKYDIEYIRNQSLWLDLRILWQTLPAIVGGKGVE